MNESIALVLKHARMVWRYRWIALVSAALVCLGGWLFVLTLPDQYRVTTKVYIDTYSLLQPVLRGLAIDTRLQENTVAMVQRTLLSRPNMETVVREADLDLQAKTDREFDALVTRLGREINVSQTRRDNIFTISYAHSDPKVATRVVNTLLNLFVEKSLGQSREGTTTTQEFLEQQIRDYEAKLETAENRLKQFKQQNMGLLPSQGGDYYSRLESVSAQLEEAKLDLQEAINRRDALERQLEDPDLRSEMFASAVTTPLDTRIENLESNLDELLLRFTEQHPDVVATKRLLVDLREQREEYLSGGGGEQSGAAGGASPLEGQLKLAIGEADAEVAALRARVQEFESRREKLKELVDQVLAVETEYNRLNRNYGIYKSRYNELVQRRESLNMSEEASRTANDVEFNIVEPPREPSAPTGPPRDKMNMAVLMLGFGGGGGLAWLVALLRPGVYSKEDLAEIAELPVLGAVSRIWTPRVAVKRRLEVGSFAVGCLVLVGLGLGTLAIGSLEIQAIDELRTAGLDRLGRLLP